jgi:hypothetical protein
MTALEMKSSIAGKRKVWENYAKGFWHFMGNMNVALSI